MSRSVWPCTAAPALRMLPPRPSLAGHLVPRWPSLAGHLLILWLLQSVTVLGYRSSDPEHITAILGQTVMYSAAQVSIAILKITGLAPECGLVWGLLPPL